MFALSTHPFLFVEDESVKRINDLLLQSADIACFFNLLSSEELGLCNVQPAEAVLYYNTLVDRQKAAPDNALSWTELQNCVDDCSDIATRAQQCKFTSLQNDLYALDKMRHQL